MRHYNFKCGASFTNDASVLYDVYCVINPYVAKVENMVSS